MTPPPTNAPAGAAPPGLARAPIDVLRVVVVDPSPNVVDAILGVLREIVYVVRHARIDEPAALEAALDGDRWDAVIFSSASQRCTIESVTAAIDARGLDLPIVALYNDRSEAEASVVELLESGAVDAVARDNRRHLRLVVEREIGNVADRRAAASLAHSLAERERRWQAVLESSRDPVAYVADGMHVHANRTYLEMFGFEQLEEIAHVPIMDLIAPPDRSRFKEVLREAVHDSAGDPAVELSGLRLDGATLDVRIELSPATFDEEDCLQLVIRDRSESLEIREQLAYLRTHDQLTGVFNREHLIERIDAALADGRPQLGLVYVELDTFNTLRESVGLDAADDLMRSVASVIEPSTPPHDVFARFGDGVFAVLCVNADRDALESRANAIVAAVAAHTVETAGSSITTTCSVGVSTMDSPRRTTQSVIREAQRACLQAKEDGGDRARVWRRGEPVAQVEASVEDVDALVSEALDAGRATLAFQPIVGITGDAPEIYEVLLRLSDADGHEIPPSRVFDADLSDAVAGRIDRWVIDEAVAMLRARLEDGQRTKLFVNLSAQAILDETLLLHLVKQLRQPGVLADDLVVEIGEALAVTQAKSVKAFISGLTELGCHAALEHFGSGICSVSMLRQIAVDYVKIDSSLVRRVASDYESESELRSIVDTARSLDRDTIAFGVEDTETLAKLCTLGVTYAQGNAIQSASEDLQWGFVTTEIE